MHAQNLALGDTIQPGAAPLSPDARAHDGAGPAHGRFGGGSSSSAATNTILRSNAELAIPRQFSETSARVSFALEHNKHDKTGKNSSSAQANLADLKRELEMWEHKVSVEELCHRLGTDAKRGLTSDEARLRLERDGPNRLNPPKSTPWWIKLGAQFLDFFAILLQIASILCFIGFALDRSSTTNLFLGIILYFVVIVTAVFSFFQDYKADALMDKLQNFLPPKAIVYRSGQSFDVDASELVVGDVIEVTLGDKLPADIRIISNQKLKVDNSALTGESEPIGRTVDPTDDNPLETKNLAFFGTLAVDGTAVGLVVNTGDDTVFGRIASLATRAGTEVTTLQVDIHHFVVFISTISITIGLLTFIVNIIDSVEWITNIVFAIGIIVAQVPEGLLATVTVSLSLSAKRMASKNVLVKKLEAVETLGSTTAICSDKTGTLTQNRMTVVHVGYGMRLKTAATTGFEASFDPGNDCFQ
jgi:sodium/potassium-transporting ATPase subunit alpha